METTLQSLDDAPSPPDPNIIVHPRLIEEIVQYPNRTDIGRIQPELSSGVGAQTAESAESFQLILIQQNEVATAMQQPTGYQNIRIRHRFSIDPDSEVKPILAAPTLDFEARHRADQSVVSVQLHFDASVHQLAHQAAVQDGIEGHVGLETSRSVRGAGHQFHRPPGIVPSGIEIYLDDLPIPRVIPRRVRPDLVLLIVHLNVQTIMSFGEGQLDPGGHRTNPNIGAYLSEPDSLKGNEGFQGTDVLREPRADHPAKDVQGPKFHGILQRQQRQNGRPGVKEDGFRTADVHGDLERIERRSRCGPHCARRLLCSVGPRLHTIRDRQ
jgi:hypothetical protein